MGILHIEFPVYFSMLTNPLETITNPVKLAEASPELVKAVQQRLNVAVDGIPGPITMDAFRRFKQQCFLSDPDWLGPTTARKLLKTSILVTQDQATAIFGRSPSVEQMADLNSCLVRFEINTPARIRAFCSQIAHETAGLKFLKELASGDAYELRKDLGNLKPGWGRLYKGGGALQTTGRYNYERLCKETGDPKVLELGASYVASYYPFTSAAVWWRDNSMNSLCDRGASVEQITRRVNGGKNGLSDRIMYYNRACQVIKG